MPTEEQTYRQKVEEKLDDIISRVTFTNGKVHWLEKMVYLAIGGLGVLAIIVFPLLFALVQAGRL